MAQAGYRARWSGSKRGYRRNLRSLTSSEECWEYNTCECVLNLGLPLGGLIGGVLWIVGVENFIDLPTCECEGCGRGNGCDAHCDYGCDEDAEDILGAFCAAGDPCVGNDPGQNGCPN